MDESSLLIIGANGQLGTALQQRWPDARAVDSDKLDITDSQALENFDWQNIKVLINAAAYTNVDGAETFEGRIAAWQVNAVGVANLVKIALKHNFTLVHISTDYVFDGTKSDYSENDIFCPLNSYGSSKAAADILVSVLSKHYIVRTSWVVGQGKNFVRTMIEVGNKGISPTVVADQIGRLTFTKELVKAIDHLVNTKADYGTYNVTNSGRPTSWADITREIFKLADYDLSVTDTTTEEYFANKEGVAQRPLNSTLNLDKIRATGFEPLEWKEGLAEYIKKELGQ